MTLFEEIKDLGIEPEIKSDETIDHFKYLIEHFRKLCEEKDAVIRAYRASFEDFKPDYEQNRSLNKKVMSLEWEINEWKNIVTNLKKNRRNLEKKIKAKDSK